jgi:hypothetical protein
MSKLSISRAWDETRSVLASDGKLIGTVALAMFVLPGLVLNLVMPRSEASQMPQPGVWIVFAIAAVLISLVGQLSMIRLALAPHVSVGEAIAHGARRILPYVASVLLWMVPFLLLGGALFAMVGKDPEHPSAAAALGLLVLTGIGVFLAVRFILTSAVASAEPIGPIAILQRSWQLTRGNWWRLFGFLLLFAIGALALLLAVESVAGLVGKMLFGDLSPLSLGGLLVSVLGQLVSGFISIILFVMLARIYAQGTFAPEVEVGVPSSGI